MNKEKEKKSCCCEHDSGEEVKDSSCKCGHDSGEEIKDGSCCCEHDSVEDVKDSSCKCGGDKSGHDAKKTHDHAEHSCCSQTNGVEKKSAHTAEHSCCSQTNGAEKKSAHTAEHSCCGHSHDGKKSSHGSCCGTKNDDKSSIIRNLVFLGVALTSLILSFLNVFGSIKFFYYVNIAWLAIILCGYPIIKQAVLSVFKYKKITASVLISVAMLASILLEILMLAGLVHGEDGHGHSYVFVAGEIAFLMAIGGMIEEFTIRRSRAGIERLVKLSPSTVKILVNGKEQEVKVTDVKVGDIALIRPDSIIAVDGIITKGYTTINEASMTGEPLPINKGIGEYVFAGTNNIDGAIEVQVTKLAADMALTKLVKLVEEAEGKKAPISRVADRWASYIVPIAITISVLVGIFTKFVFQISTIEALIRGITILVVFCPCSLALATPTAIAAGLGAGAKAGLLIKSGASLETMAQVKSFAFDKTGTLTRGELSVSNVLTYNITEEKLFDIIYSIEIYSEHPVAKALMRYKTDSKLLEVTDIKSRIGEGIEGVIGDKKWEIIKIDDNVMGENDHAIKGFRSEGKTVICVMSGGEVYGVVALSDTIRDGAKETIAELKDLGINSIMLTGDNDKSADYMAKQVDINYLANLMPQDKLEYIKNEMASVKICMAGDGVNDAPSLATASVSIAFAHLGNDIAIDTADISLIGSDINKIPFLVRLSRRVMGTIKGNIILSMSINFIAVILSTLGILDPVTGALVHNLSSILVVLNSSSILARKIKQ